jgi:hypothetical protein
VPVIVRESYYPNWRVRGADGPYRVTPNFMVVVPTSRTVTLTYGRSPAEWVGILLTLVGLAGLVVLGRRWPRLAQGPEPRPEYERLPAPVVVAEVAVGAADDPVVAPPPAPPGEGDPGSEVPEGPEDAPAPPDPLGWGRIGGDGPAGDPSHHE